jgi:hypothetical protein
MPHLPSTRLRRAFVGVPGRLEFMIYARWARMQQNNARRSRVDFMICVN